MQELTTDCANQLRSSRTEYGSATNPNICQFVSFRGIRGLSGIGVLSIFVITCYWNDYMASTFTNYFQKCFSEGIITILSLNTVIPTSVMVWLSTVPRRYFFCGSFFILCLPLLYWLLVTCWERADFLALLFVMYSCVFVTFQYSILDQVWYLIVSIPDLCHISCIDVSIDRLFIAIPHLLQSYVSFLSSAYWVSTQTHFQQWYSIVSSRWAVMYTRPKKKRGI